MTRRLTAFSLAALFIAGILSPNSADAQTPVLGGLVEGRSYYNGYGIRDYPAYGRPLNDKYSGFGHPYGVTDFSYSGYGNGPYGAGSGSEHEFLSTNRYGNNNVVYDGYGIGGYADREHIRRYNPYGQRVPKWARFDD